MDLFTTEAQDEIASEMTLPPPPLPGKTRRLPRHVATEALSQLLCFMRTFLEECACELTAEEALGVAQLNWI